LLVDVNGRAMRVRFDSNEAIIGRLLIRNVEQVVLDYGMEKWDSCFGTIGRSSCRLRATIGAAGFRGLRTLTDWPRLRKHSWGGLYLVSRTPQPDLSDPRVRCWSFMTEELVSSLIKLLRERSDCLWRPRTSRVSPGYA
jgi:hypothetical protein